MIVFLTSLLIFFLGTIAGSFLTSLTFRIPRKISFIKGRSFCPNCKKTISWYDNIPLLSYFILNGKCRNCGKKISGRYPVIEFVGGIGFLLIWYFLRVCSQSMYETRLYLCNFDHDLGSFAFPFLLTIFIFVLALFIIDYEGQILPDDLTLTLFVLGLVFLIFFKPESLYINLFSGILAALFFASLNWATKGKGMGLGDAKLALAGGVFLGKIVTVDWVLLSFIVGGLISLYLILSKKVKMKDRIPFGPILIFSFILEIIFGPIVFSVINL